MRAGIVLAAGTGSRAWPYAVVRPKGMIPIANKPLLSYSIDAMKAIGITRITVVAGEFAERISNYYRSDPEIRVVKFPSSQGTADSLIAALHGSEEDEVLVAYGDTIVDADDLKNLADLFAKRGNAALVDPLGAESSRDWICCSVEENRITDILGHPRGGATHRFAAFAFGRDIFPHLLSNSGIFTNVQVGMMPPTEGFVEMSLADWIADGHEIAACETHGTFLDVDKPWQILEANRIVGQAVCESLTGNELAEGASIDESADIEGFVRLGKDSTIGRNVRVRGNLIVGDRTRIENGAIIEGHTIVGNDCLLANYCMIDGGAIVGDRCVINHCAELNGLLMENVYLYHYMEFYGILGCNTDLGAATVCGTLRFDDGETTHTIKGRREHPRDHSNASYLGDYVRTGVNAIIMPGCKVGVYSIVGPGVLLSEDLPNGTRVSVKQVLERGDWGPDRYGW